MRIVERVRELNLVPYLVIFYMVGIIGLKIPYTYELFKVLVPFNLLLNFLLLVIYHGRITTGFIWKALVVFMAGLLVELAGVNTGAIFGSYEYGPTLGPKVFHTPVIIGLNWLMLIYASLVISSRFLETPYFRAVIAAVIMVVYDFALEPSAIQLDMWNWGGAVPMQNYLAWLVISFILALFADRTGMVNRQNKIAAPLFFVQFAFFIVLDIWMMIMGVWE